jgi:DNA-binding winged helix-turn-helix (wHTH) protein
MPWHVRARAIVIEPAMTPPNPPLADQPSSRLYRYRFGSAEFDESRFELRVGGVAVEVQQKPLQLLALLLSRRGETLTRDELYDAVWRDRVTVEHVLANAVSKLRTALGEANAAMLVTVPRVGYRLEGPVQRFAIGTAAASSSLELAPGMAVPQRTGLTLDRLLGRSLAHETWLVMQAGVRSPRVFKFAASQVQLVALKREVTVYRLLEETLGDRDHFARVLDWNFDEPPFWLACEYGGTNLAEWAHAEGAATDGAAAPSPRVGAVGGAPAAAGDAAAALHAGGPLAALARHARLELFVQIADAVAAAHSVGVLHRDLKPANVLIEQRGNAFVLRLTDFGSARVLDPERLAALRITRLGLTAQAGAEASSGTPLYMAPEVAQGTPPSVAADVYALGVMLFQLLVGDLRRVPVAGWEREIDDDLLREDIARAIDGDPRHRLASAAELSARLRTLDARCAARDREAHDRREADRARAALARSRARLPWAATAIGLALLALAASLVWVQRERAAGVTLSAALARSEAERQWLREAVVGAEGPATARRDEASVADALLAAAVAIDERFSQQPAADRAALHAAAQAALADIGLADAAVAAGQRALALLPRPLPLRQDVSLRLAADLLDLGRGDEAAALLRDTSADAPSAGMGENSAAGAFRLRLLNARVAVVQGDPRATQALSSLWSESEDPAHLRWRGTVGAELAEQWLRQGQAARAEPMLRALLDEQRRRFGEQDLRVGRVRLQLGRVLIALGRLAEAAPMVKEGANQHFARLGGGRSLAMREVLDLTARAHLLAGETTRARATWQLLREWLGDERGANSSDTQLAQAHVGLAMTRAGEAAAAEPVLREALQRAAIVLDADAPQLHYQRLLLAECLLALDRAAAAREVLAGIDADAVERIWPEREGGMWRAQLASLRQRAGDVQGESAR